MPSRRAPRPPTTRRSRPPHRIYPDTPPSPWRAPTHFLASTLRIFRLPSRSESHCQITASRASCSRSITITRRMIRFGYCSAVNFASRSRRSRSFFHLAPAIRRPRSDAALCLLRLNGPFHSLCICSIRDNYLFGRCRRSDSAMHFASADSQNPPCGVSSTLYRPPMNWIRVHGFGPLPAVIMSLAIWSARASEPAASANGGLGLSLVFGVLMLWGFLRRGCARWFGLIVVNRSRHFCAILRVAAVSKSCIRMASSFHAPSISARRAVRRTYSFALRRWLLVAEPIGPGDGGLGVLLSFFGIVTSWVVRAAPDLYRSATAPLQNSLRIEIRLQQHPKSCRTHPCRLSPR